MEDDIFLCHDFLLDVVDNIGLLNETQEIKDTIVEVTSIEVVVDNVDVKVEATWRV
jgi:hypothetical protein